MQSSPSSGRSCAAASRVYRGDRPPVDVEGRVVILVDDGLATETTMRAAIAGLRQLRPRQLIAAVPVAAPDACAELARLVDFMACVATRHICMRSASGTQISCRRPIRKSDSRWPMPPVQPATEW